MSIEHVFPEAQPLEIYGWPERVAKERKEKQDAAERKTATSLEEKGV